MICKLRKDARDQIDRLIQFLDATHNPHGAGAERRRARLLISAHRLAHGSLDTGPELTEPRTLTLRDDEEDDASEDDDLAEPALGSLDGRDDQTRWAARGGKDLERYGAESGIGDLDGLLEQVGCGGWQGDRTGIV